VPVFESPENMPVNFGRAFWAEVCPYKQSEREKRQVGTPHRTCDWFKFIPPDMWTIRTARESGGMI